MAPQRSCHFPWEPTEDMLPGQPGPVPGDPEVPAQRPEVPLVFSHVLSLKSTPAPGPWPLQVAASPTDCLWDVKCLEPVSPESWGHTAKTRRAQGPARGWQPRGQQDVCPPAPQLCSSSPQASLQGCSSPGLAAAAAGSSAVDQLRGQLRNSESLQGRRLAGKAPISAGPQSKSQETDRRALASKSKSERSRKF